MYQFNIVTLFPELFAPLVSTSLIGKAVAADLLGFRFIDLRQYATDKHRTVDDTPYGGGSGMVLMTRPVLDVLAEHTGAHRILMSPRGQPFRQADARRLAQLDRPLLLFCARYEGIDERVLPHFDAEYSIGDFVLNGGEVAAMAIIEAISRLIPGVIGNMASTQEESFSAGLLEYPQYTRPEIIDGAQVPAVLLSGNHQRIAAWRHGQALLATMERRPDLFAAYEMTDKERQLLDAALQERNNRDA
ncbi:MAG: tRNA (guanosine(37)-N1)-methyltransferase TrmD [Myxococcales bacterium]|nr:tRNA (guanosine(37)-N1)-methyltransferase TrmD [Myxococcales bacterium]